MFFYVSEVSCDLGSPSLTSDPYHEAGELPESRESCFFISIVRLFSTLNVFIIHFHLFHADRRVTAGYCAQFGGRRHRSQKAEESHEQSADSETP